MQILSQLLTPSRTLCGVAGSSKKKMFEALAETVCINQDSITVPNVFSKLVAREKLGSTGLGGGIAIPHCRLEDCKKATGALITLEKPIDFDAPDDIPVDLLFILVVPEDNHQEHLKILAQLASLFSQETFCRKLRETTSSEQLYRLAVDWAVP